MNNIINVEAINKFPIIVMRLAPQCGSTHCVKLLQDKFKFPVFNDPWSSNIYKENSKMENYVSYIDYRSKSNKYIVKFWYYQLEQRSPYHKDMETGYKILLTRKDVVSQIASWYINDEQKKQVNINDEYVIHIDKFKISQFIEMVTIPDFYTKNIDIFDKHLYYEDMNIVKKNQPKNIEELTFEIQKQMKNQIPFHWKITK